MARLEVDRAVAAARAAYDTTWGPMKPADRRRLLTRFADLLATRRDEFATIATLEMGLCSAMSAQIDAAFEWTHYYAGWADKIEGIVASGFSPADEFAYTLAEPYGVIGHIITWNAPLLSLSMKVPASLAAGNTVVIKPAEFTPFTALLFAELAREAGIPDGVINVVQGDGSAGEALVRHPGVGKVSFTGGPSTAKRIMATAAESLKPVLFELGGKSPNLLFADADLEASVAYSAAFSMSCVGQGCALPTRLLVEETIYDEVVETVVATVEALPVGDPAGSRLVLRTSGQRGGSGTGGRHHRRRADQRCGRAAHRGPRPSTHGRLLRGADRLRRRRQHERPGPARGVRSGAGRHELPRRGARGRSWPTTPSTACRRTSRAATYAGSTDWSPGCAPARSSSTRARTRSPSPDGRSAGSG